MMKSVPGIVLLMVLACGLQAVCGQPYYTVAQKEWGLAVSAVLTYRNIDDFSSLTGCAAAAVDVASHRSILSNDWGVDSREELLSTLDRLMKKGHRGSMREIKQRAENWPPFLFSIYDRFKQRDPSYRSRISFIRNHTGELDETSLTGWDLMRLVSVVRWGVASGYLSEDEAWEWIMPAARILQSTFTSWSDLGADYLLGRQFWSEYNCWKNGYLYDEAVFWLNSNQESPWKKLDWNLDLTGSPQLAENEPGLPETAQYFEALCMLSDQNYTEAVECLHLSIEQDSNLYKGKACLKLGNIYTHGRTGIPVDPATARSFFEKGAAFGNEDCLLVLGCNYYAGDGVPKDYGKALDLWEQAAAQGSPVAFSNIGLLYADGKGVERDVQRTLEYEHRALKAGSTAADNNLAWLMYQNPSLWNPDEAVRHAYEGVRKWEKEDFYDTLVKVLIKAEHYPEAMAACRRWIDFYQKEHHNFDDAVFPSRFKTMLKEIESKMNQ